MKLQQHNLVRVPVRYLPVNVTVGSALVVKNVGEVTVRAKVVAVQAVNGDMVVVLEVLHGDLDNLLTVLGTERVEVEVDGVVHSLVVQMVVDRDVSVVVGGMPDGMVVNVVEVDSNVGRSVKEGNVSPVSRGRLS